MRSGTWLHPSRNDVGTSFQKRKAEFRHTARTFCAVEHFLQVCFGALQCLLHGQQRHFPCFILVIFGSSGLVWTSDCIATQLDSIISRSPSQILVLPHLPNCFHEPVLEPALLIKELPSQRLRSSRRASYIYMDTIKLHENRLSFSVRVFESATSQLNLRFLT